MSKRKRREPVILPDEECERLRRTEMNGLRMLLAHLSTACYFQEDIQDRLNTVIQVFSDMNTVKPENVPAA